MNAAFTLLRLALGALLLYAGALKALDPAAFATALGHYRLFPEPLLAPLATLLPWLEIAVGAALLLRRLALGASALSAVLALGFVVALGSAWARGLDLDCGCFGAGDNARPTVALARASVLLLVSLALLVRAARATIDSAPPPR